LRFVKSERLVTVATVVSLVAIGAYVLGAVLIWVKYRHSITGHSTTSWSNVNGRIWRSVPHETKYG